MWIHPVLHRALSVREAARLQTFPDSFVFCGPKDSQYQQVGNAAPPILAKAIAEHLCGFLDKETVKRNFANHINGVTVVILFYLNINYFIMKNSFAII